jgi:hypothetical protein
MVVQKLEVLLIITAPFDWGYYSYNFGVKFIRINLISVPVGRSV